MAVPQSPPLYLDPNAIANNLVSEGLKYVAGALFLYFVQRLVRPWLDHRSKRLAKRRLIKLSRELQQIAYFQKQPIKFYGALFSWVFGSFAFLSFNLFFLLLLAFAASAPPTSSGDAGYQVFLLLAGSVSLLLVLLCAQAGHRIALGVTESYAPSLQKEIDLITTKFPDLVDFQKPATVDQLESLRF